MGAVASGKDSVKWIDSIALCRVAASVAAVFSHTVLDEKVITIL